MHRLDEMIPLPADLIPDSLPGWAFDNCLLAPSNLGRRAGISAQIGWGVRPGHQASQGSAWELAEHSNLEAKWRGRDVKQEAAAHLQLSRLKLAIVSAAPESGNSEVYIGVII